MKNLLLLALLFLANVAAYAQFNKGTKVMINYQDQWYPGKILEVKENKTYLVSYDDYDASWNEVVSTDRLKLIESNSNPQKVATPSTPTQSKSPSASGEKKAAEMCACLKNMMKTQKQEDKSKCLSMQEEHVAALGKGSEEYTIYKKLVGNCEKEISSTKTSNPVTSGKEPVTYEEKVKAVCDCFKEARSNPGKTPECYKKQSDYSKSVGGKKTDFTKETNGCAN